MAYRDIFEEIPIRVRNSALAKALLSSIQPEKAVTSAAAKRLAIDSGASLERNLTSLNELLDDVMGEQQKVCMHAHTIDLPGHMFGSMLPSSSCGRHSGPGKHLCAVQRRP